MSLTVEPIGVVRTPYTERRGMPIQPSGAEEATARVELDPAYAAGVKDLDGFSHITLIFAFDRSEGYELEVVPFLDDRPRGVFATRAPRRPNPIGVSTVRLEAVEGDVLHIRGPDMLDGTPVLDIKPCTPELGPQEPVRRGWLEQAQQDFSSGRSDGRFTAPGEEDADAAAAPSGDGLGVVLTGATRGLGLAMAREFLRAGDRVVICGRDRARLARALEALRGELEDPERVGGTACDVARPEEGAQLAAFAARRLGRIDRWVNNAGTAGTYKRPLTELPTADIHATCSTNLSGTMQLCAEAIRAMQAQPATGEPAYHVFNFGFSALGVRLSRTSLPHRVSKRAVAHLSAELREELRAAGERRIGVHEVRPGLVRTDLLLTDLPERARPIIDRLAEPPEDVARALVPRMRAIEGLGRTLDYRSKARMLARAVPGVARMITADR